MTLSPDLIRRAAPAAALTGIAVAIVAMFEPALTTGTGKAAAVAAAPTHESAAAADEGTCSSVETLTGDTAHTPWGPVQVTATVDGSTLCSIQATAYPSDDPRSQQINSYAIPILDEAAVADGVDFQAVSGATYTSEGYRTSLQSILDRM